MKRREFINKKVLTIENVRAFKYPNSSYATMGDIFKSEQTETIRNIDMLGEHKVGAMVEALKNLLEKTIKDFDERKSSIYRNFGITHLRVTIYESPIDRSRSFHISIAGRWISNEDYDQNMKVLPQPESNLEQFLYIHARELFAQELTKNKRNSPN